MSIGIGSSWAEDTNDSSPFSHWLEDDDDDYDDYDEDDSIIKHFKD